MLTIAGRETSRDMHSATIVYIARASQDVQPYATHKLVKAIRDDDGTQRGLLNVGIWCIGEFGDLVLQPYTYVPPSSSGALGEVSDAASGTSPSSISFMGLDPMSVVNVVEHVMARHSCVAEVKERCLTCLAKLSDRFATAGDSNALLRLEDLVRKNKTSHSLEMQLRACEYDALLMAAKGILPPKSAPGDDLFGAPGGATISPAIISAAKEALTRMPIVDLKVLQKKKQADDFYDDMGSGPATKPVAAVKQKGGGDLLDLADIFGGDAPSSVQNGTTSLPSSDLDLLSDIFSAPPVAVSSVPHAAVFDPFSGMAAPVVVAPAASTNPVDLFGATLTPVQAAPSGGVDMFGAASSFPMAAPVVSPANPMASVTPADRVRVHAFAHQGLSVDFECTKPDTWNKQKSTLVANFTNTTDAPIYGLSMQCAVPKYVTMDMQPPTSTTIPQSGGNSKAITQTIVVTNSMMGSKNLMLKLKVGFTSKGTKIEHMATASGFPAGQY